MAILFRILFTLGLLILHVSVLSAQPPQVNSNASGGSPLTFVSANPPYILASTVKSAQTYLNCDVAVKIAPAWKKHLSSGYNFYREKLEDDDDEDEDLPDENNDEIVKKMYQMQSQQQHNKSIKIDHEILSNPKVRNGKRRIKRDAREPLLFEWFRDGEKVISTKNDDKPIINPSGLSLFANGTLMFQASNATAGEYRCQAKYLDPSQKFVIGPIVSTATVVEAAHLINDSNDRKNSTIFEGESVVVNCPISSVPHGNYSWNFNNNELNFDSGSRSRDARHFLLSNGSLLIVNSQTTDSGKYRCNATNQFAKKLFRSSFSVLTVAARSAKDDNHESRLLPQLQNSTQKIKSGRNLVLHCASGGTKKISWTFTPRTSDIPISLPEFSNELKYVNVSVTRHDGIYNCSTESDFQLFDVFIGTPPVFLESLNSMETSVLASIKFNCSVSGNPPTKVEWYKNGELVPSNHVRHFEYPIIKIETIDPQDEGLYQCVARNDFGEASNTFYLHVRPQLLLNNPPQNQKCSPMGNGMVHVTFDHDAHSNKIYYFIATDSPREFYSQISQDIAETFGAKLSFKINTTAARIIKPLKPFFLYMRNLAYTTSDREQRLIVSTLSKPIECATQGIEPKFVKAPTGGIFLRWDVPEIDVPITGFTIQFLNNGTSMPVQFIEEVIGTYENWPAFVSWNDIVPKLEKIKVRNTNHSEWTEVRVPGNVTGLYVINTDEVYVKILGTTLESGELFDQDLSYLNWTNIKASSISLEPLTVGEIDARSAEVSWTGLDSVQCAYICTQLKSVFPRDASEKFKCEKINSLSAKSYDLRNLQPTSNYVVQIRDCSKVWISTAENFQTNRDVPSAVTQSRIVTDNGIVLHWKPPLNTNGDISHYLVEWTYKNVSHEQNITGLSFKFPNTTNSDQFNITVRAFGVAGLGSPLIINPGKWGILPFNVIGSAEPQSTTVYLDSFMIFAIIFISLMLLVLVVGYILLKRHRYCKNSNGIINSEQSSFPPPTSPLAENIRTDEMYEMQTLIPTTQVLSNGTEALKKPDSAPNGGINENQKILRTSTPTDESADQLCIELPPISCDGSLAMTAERAKTTNGYLETGFSPKPPSTTEQKDMKNGSVKANGNSSPFKCFQASGNDQNSSSGSSSFDSHRQLIDTNAFNSLSNSATNDRSRIGKSSSIETDNEEDSEENLHEYDLNDSNLSSKPLHPMSWNFRRPLVGPNG